MFLQMYIRSGLYVAALSQPNGGLPNKVSFAVEGRVIALKMKPRCRMESKAIRQVDGLEHCSYFMEPVGPPAQHLQDEIQLSVSRNFHDYAAPRIRFSQPL
jgi:hypothetical protein